MENIKIEEVDEQSEFIKDVLQQPPKWIYKYGLSVFFILILILLCISNYIKYPDVISGEAVIVTKNPPLHVAAYSSGKMVSILKKEGEEVKEGEQILVLENPTDEKQITGLKKYLEETHRLLSLQDHATLYPLPNAAFLVGDLQAELNALSTSLSTINTLACDSFYSKRVANLQKQLRHYQALVALNEKQQALSKKIEKNAIVKFSAQKKLFEQEAIAKLDFLKEEDQYTHVQNQVQESEKVLVQNQITLGDYEKQLNELTFDGENKLRNEQLKASQHLSNLKNQLLSWQRSYTIQATKGGRVSFLRPLSAGEFIKQGEELLVLIPNEQGFVAQVHLPALNTGKIKPGQAVNIKLSNFPSTEFGQLRGMVQSLSRIADDKGNYWAAVSLPNGLITGYKKTIPYQPEMKGSADIITDNLSVLQRVFFQFRKWVER